MVLKPQKIEVTPYPNLFFKEIPRFKLLPEPQKLLANMGATWAYMGCDGPKWANLACNGLRTSG
jgi:hypothetical protein